MRIFLIFCLLIMGFPAPAGAALPSGVTKIEFRTIQCATESKTSASATNDTITAPDGMAFVKIDCSPQDLLAYPFLKDLTKDPLQKGDSYTFNIARIADSVSKEPYFLVNMRNAMIYSDWGSTGTFGVGKDGSYYPVWNVNNGTTVYTLSCPKQFSYILSSNSAKAFSQWAYDGKNILHIGDFDAIENIPSCM